MHRHRASTGSAGLDRWLRVAPWPIHLLTPDGEPCRPNPALAHLLGYSIAELDQEVLGRCIPSATRQRLHEIGTHLHQPAAPPYLEWSLTYHHRDGTEIRARRARVGPLDDPSSVVMVMLDRLNRQPILNRADIQSRLSRLINHDLNNVFTVAQSYVELAHRQGTSARLADDYLQRAASAIRRGIRVSRQLQTISLNTPLPFEESSLEDVLDSLRPYIPRLLSPGAQWSMNYPEDLPLVYSHPVLLTRLILDLCTNAHIRWPHSAELTLKARSSPRDRAAILLRVTPPMDTAAALTTPFHSFLSKPHLTPPEDADPMFLYGIVKDHPISIDTASDSLTALLPAIDT